MSGPAVVFVHGWGGSFARTWQQPGWAALVADAGRTAIGVDLLGHGEAPKPHEPSDYTDLTARIIDALPDEPVDAVGFSLGAMTLLELATREPQRFNRLALLGIGENVFRRDDERRLAIIAAVEGNGGNDDVNAQLFAQYANQPGNDPAALAAIMKRRPAQALVPEALRALTMPVLVVLGDRDFAGPPEPLLAALPTARLVTLRKTDHFATTESFACIDAVLDFLGAVPG